MLDRARSNVETVLRYPDRGAAESYIAKNWAEFDKLLDAWWRAYKAWERQDTFAEAFQQNRMTVRTFPAGFAGQVNKKFSSIDMATSRMMPDRNYETRFDRKKQFEYNDMIRDQKEAVHYHAKRGIDSSAFADPANFASHAKKYAEGLHDLSASLLNKDVSIFDQIHNTEDGAHFAFLPLSQMEDQALLFSLIRVAKAMQPVAPQFHERVRGFRAEMTRVKLAAEFDMGVGYTAVHAPTPDGTGPQFKIRYGLGDTTTVVGNKALKVTPAVYEARQQAAINFKSILGIREAKNEILVAIRRHAGAFPIYATRAGNVLKCYVISGTTMLPDRQTISARGVLS